MTKVNVMAEQKYEQQLAHILLFLITVQSLISFELTSNVGQFFVYTLDFGLFAFACKFDVISVF